VIGILFYFVENLAVLHLENVIFTTLREKETQRILDQVFESGPFGLLP